jgi:4-amino-4-deoxy-L-arabinose transferase-like glycosyltransferase
MTVGLLLAVTWAAVLPAFQAPDEQAHFSYAQTLAARDALPGTEGRPLFSTELSEGIAAVNSDQVAAQLQVKPEWDPQLEREWAAKQGQWPDDDGGGPGPATAYPPTSYAWQALGYAAASGGSLWDELFGARLMSALWIPVMVLGTWLLAGEVFGPRRVLQSAAAAVPALAPMVVFITSSVSPDGMLYAAWTIALWLGVRCIRRGLPLRDGIAFFAVVGLACTIKPTSYALIPAALLVALFGLMSRRRVQPRRAAVIAATTVAVLALTLGAWVLIAGLLDRPADAVLTQAIGNGDTNWRELASYVWQYYLPRTPVQQDVKTVVGYPLLQVWITQGWAAFGWLEVKFDPWVYRVLGPLTVAIFGAALLALLKAWRRVDRRVLLFLAAVVVVLFAGLHWTEYHQYKTDGTSFMQGRYAFPLIGIFGLALAGALSLVPARLRGAATGAVVAGLLVFHLFALGLVIERFYV